MNMRTGYLSATGKVEVKGFEVPELDDDSVLMKVKSAGIAAPTCMRSVDRILSARRP